MTLSYVFSCIICNLKLSYPSLFLNFSEPNLHTFSSSSSGSPTPLNESKPTRRQNSLSPAKKRAQRRANNLSPRRKAENTPKLTDVDKEQPKKKKNSKTKSVTKENETTDLSLNKEDTEENKIENQNPITSNQPQEKKNTAYYLPAHEDTFVKEGKNFKSNKPQNQLDVKPELGTEKDLGKAHSKKNNVRSLRRTNTAKVKLFVIYFLKIWRKVSPFILYMQ